MQVLMFFNSVAVKTGIFCVFFLPFVFMRVESNQIVNPLEVYVNQTEGIALYQSHGDAAKVFTNIMFSDDMNDWSEIGKRVWGKYHHSSHIALELHGR